jgi:hypothetical protein
MARQTVVETLKAALKKFRNGKAWTQGAMAKDKNGEYTSPKRKNAVSFCAYGAVEAAGGRKKLALAFLDAAARNSGRDCAIDFNDHDGRTFAEVKDLFKSAIKSAKAAA